MSYIECPENENKYIFIISSSITVNIFKQEMGMRRVIEGGEGGKEVKSRRKRRWMLRRQRSMGRDEKVEEE